ncbi:MAG: HD domain-containing protein [Candidatus Omnitrophica bacterium]|nr:HD domain-containing protein [Candidatus Omnitrophota bacterium]
MSIDYKKELESAARTMILVHNPDILIKMIVRMIVQKVRVTHAGILLHNRQQDNYILTVSRGKTGLKIPAGFARIDADNPLIRFFREDYDKNLFNNNVMIKADIKNLLEKEIPEDTREFLKQNLYQMEILEAVACIPSYFRDELLGILILGNKISGEEFKHEELDFFSALASDVAMAIRNAQLFKDLEEELERRKRLFINTIIALATAIEAKDHYTGNHTERVTDLCLKIAKRLALKNKKTIDDEFLASLRVASLLHDIGKIGIPESILNKNGPLNEEERRFMQQHTLVGVNILQPIKELKKEILGVKYHHERYDGTGYPEGLKGESIPLIASIISIADAFDAMITDRPYRTALPKQKAIEEIKSLSGKQFSTELVEVLVELYQEGLI